MTILDRIVEDTRRLLERRRRTTPASRLEEMARAQPAPRSFETALRAEGLSVIAEIKKASPSRGLIREDFDVARVARQYARGGARAVSVLTEPAYFQGALENLRLAREACPLPLLRKDFIVDTHQLLEARAYGADAVLLIAAVLDRAELVDLLDAAHGLGLDCLVEVYEEAELDRIDLDRVRILGVNNRDLRTFEVDLDHSLRIFRQVPASLVRVSESGMKTGADLARLRRHGVDAVLIGETLMRAPDPGDELAGLIAAAERASTAPAETPLPRA